jgi:F-type H+-transporting ATPase subunit alpha
MDPGHDVFVVFDDLTKHAWIYRQISLLLERPPGREAYPGDIFYLHSQFIERAGKYNQENGGGSMTFFPIVETLQGDVTGYVSSNLVSMTDGQIYLNTNFFNEGLKPAIDPSLSVSRIGSKAQFPQMRELSGLLRLEFVQYQELLKVTRFKGGAAEDIAARLRHGSAMRHLFLQNRNEPFSRAKQIILLYALNQKVLDVLDKEQTEYFKNHFESWIQTHDPKLHALLQQGNLPKEAKKNLDKDIIDFLKEAHANLKDHDRKTKT